MASSSSYGDRPPLQGYRRSFTVPHRQLSHHEQAGLQQSDATAEILYSHLNARIVKFSLPEDSIIANSNVIPPNTDYPVDTIETFPWRSKTETLSSTGLMIIEKVRGSVYFLKAGPVIYTIMRNSQCWCVDGESKFVLRIRKFHYYRVELPISTAEEKEKVEELKRTLSSILRFERTPCPFIRAFHVELPEDAITPRRKGPWKRREGSLNSPPDSSSPPLRRTKNLRSWSMRNPITLESSDKIGPRPESDSGLPRNNGAALSSGQSLDGARSRTPSSLGSRDDPDDHESYDQSSDSGISDQDPKTEQIKSEDERKSPGKPQSEHSVIPEIEETPTSTVVAFPFEKPEPLAGSADLEIARDDDLHLDISAPYNEASGSEEENLAIVKPDEDSLSEKTDIPEHLSGGIETESEKQMPRQSVVKEPSCSTSDASHVIEPTADINSRPESKLTEEKQDHADAIPNESDNFQTDSQAPLSPQISKESGIFNDSASMVSSMDSFHTMESIDRVQSTDGPQLSDEFDKTPLADPLDPLRARNQQHKRELSELTVTAFPEDSQYLPTLQARSETSESIGIDRPSTPMLDRSSTSDASWSDVQTPSTAFIREGLQRRLKHHQSSSPVLGSANGFSNPRQSQGSHMTSVILQKACNVALVKPIEVVLLLVHIVARIAGGATVNDLLSGDLFRRPQHARKTSNFPESIGSAINEADDEDDFAVPVRGRTTSKDAAKTNDTDTDSIYGLD